MILRFDRRRSSAQADDVVAVRLKKGADAIAVRPRASVRGQVAIRDIKTEDEADIDNLPDSDEIKTEDDADIDDDELG